MQTCARVKRRFGRSAVAVSLRDRSKHSDLETGRFFHKTCQFSVIARREQFLRDIAPHRFSNVLFRKLFRFQTFRSGNRFVFPQNPPDLSLRGGRVRPTRQSLTERFVIPERTMVARDETEPWNEERKRNDAAIPMFFVISIPFCYGLPCFGAGCHTFGFQIATAALRPRNDTKLGRFWGKNSLLCKDFDTLKGSAGQRPALPFFAILMRQRSSLARRANFTARPCRGTLRFP